MRRKAELFDNLQYLYEVTGFNDHQLHCVIRFADKLDAGRLRQAVELLLAAVPLLTRVYRPDNGAAFWEEADRSLIDEAFQVVYHPADFDRFTTSRTDESGGPQIRVCLLDSEANALSIILNHMVGDAAAFKQCLYRLADIYSRLRQDPAYRPGYMIDGERGFEQVLAGISLRDRFRALVFHAESSNQSGRHSFPFSPDEDCAPFILTHTVTAERGRRLQEYCAANRVTLNDVLLTAYYRVLSKKLHQDGRPLHIPIMVDMRRYLPPGDTQALSNLSSMIDTCLAIVPGEPFQATLVRVHRAMDLKKACWIGLNAFIKLALLRRVFRLIGPRRSYRPSQSKLRTPRLCMTNIGSLDAAQLVFRGASIRDAFMCGSIKYRPHFQVALSSYNGRITLSSNLYGSRNDRLAISAFLESMEAELPVKL